MSGISGCHLHWQSYFSRQAPDTAAGEGTSSCIRPSKQQHIEETLICKEPVTPFAPPMAAPDDSVPGAGLRQTGDSLSQDLLQSLSCSCAWRMLACTSSAGMLLGSGRQSVYKSCIQNADQSEIPEQLASAAALLHSVQVKAQPWSLSVGAWSLSKYSFEFAGTATMRIVVRQVL